MTTVYLDLETLPTTDAEIIAEIHAGVKPPGNIKKAETLEAWWKDEGEQAKADAVAKNSFDAAYGRIACICAAVDDGQIVGFYDDDETILLADFGLWLYDQTRVDLNTGSAHRDVTFCGHNILGFDLPFLKHRSIINKVTPHHALMKAFSAKPWGNEVADTMLMWSADSQKRASMDKLCKAFGIKGKDGFDGSMGAATWPTDPGKVVDYCKDDVRRTREIYKRITFQF